MPQRSPGPFFAPLAPAGFPTGAPAPLFTPDRSPRPEHSGAAHLQTRPATGRSPRLPARTPSSPAPSSSSDTGRRAPSSPDTGRRTQPSPGPGRRAQRGRPDPVPGSTISGRLAVAAVAAGALATAGHGIATGLSEPAGAPATGRAALTADSLPLPAAPTSGPARATTDAATTDVLPVSAAPRAAAGGQAGQVEALSKSRKRADEAVARTAAARAPQFVKPAQGRFTSGFGSRWGTSHQGVDIANAIGTPIVSVADGVVTAAGPASGFGQWVKVRLADGSETVYGHVNRFFVSEGDTVKAGQRIAEIGNRGQSTGPHLHFEVHTPSGKKINPLPWLAEHGISLGAQQD